ncbi:MAG: MASE1 domain-containing protein [Planctomycetota bacterium]|jgi:integral membrane sensor domain MASE1
MGKSYLNHRYDTIQGVLRPYLWIGLIALAYYLCSRLSLFFVQPKGVTIFWPPSGLLLAFLLLSERRLWKHIIPAVFLVNLVANIIMGNNLVANLGHVVANCTEGFVGAWILQRLMGTPITLKKFKKVLVFAVISVLLATAIGASIGAGVFALKNDLFMFMRVWRIWWLADTLGILIVTPAFLAWKDIFSTLIKMRLKRSAEMVLLFTCMVIVSILIFKPSGEDVRPLLYIVFPFLIWASLRFGMWGAFSGSLIIVSIAVWHTIHGHGPMTTHGEKASEYIVWLQAYLGVMMISALIMVANTTRRNQVEERLKLHNESLKKNTPVFKDRLADRMETTELEDSRMQTVE